MTLLDLIIGLALWFFLQIVVLLIAFRWVNLTIRGWITFFQTQGKGIMASMIPKVGIKDAIGLGLVKVIQSPMFDNFMGGLMGGKKQ